ncbi:hypothetical protein TR13x_07285 [Caloranaerobacter sp. TR13]|uniref:CBO2463/CBO2479 domain-containing protein n=1 Tax=Caloranaerobacter sp. TR13 TaxID=1302151 RepID=UPI0006D3EB85|nr:CBO2463/CBO2479 domain-containing protein [Caloranaerobacter sp. TR13]KPU27059.1 hypothetical protein TR13x_07285 [Caloranaerobacter sp. TR13]
MNRFKYSNSPMYFEGVIVELKDGLVGIDLKGRLGHIRIPKRMLITDYDLKLGHEVGFMLSYPEVLSDDINEKYINSIRFKKGR